jgi:hypothetical protein
VLELVLVSPADLILVPFGGFGSNRYHQKEYNEEGLKIHFLKIVLFCNEKSESDREGFVLMLGWIASQQ